MLTTVLLLLVIYLLVFLLLIMTHQTSCLEFQLRLQCLKKVWHEKLLKNQGEKVIHCCSSLWEKLCLQRPPPPSTLANSNFPLLKWFFFISDNIAMYPYLKEHLLLMFVSSNPTVKIPLLHTWKKDLRTDRPPSSLPENLWAFLRSFT